MDTRRDAAPTPPDATGRIACYRDLLGRYRRTLDLVSDRAFARLDALVDDAVAFARAADAFGGDGTILDLGTGSGLPGAVIAAMLPARRMVWVERRRRRAAFLRTVAATCGFGGVRVLDRDVDAVTRADLGGPLAVVTAQAVGDLALVVRLTRHLVGRELVVVTRRGSEWEEELHRLRADPLADFAVLAAERLSADGTLVVVRVAGAE